MLGGRRYRSAAERKHEQMSDQSEGAEQPDGTEPEEDPFYAQSIHAALDPDISRQLRRPLVQIAFEGCLMVQSGDAVKAFTQLDRKVLKALATQKMSKAALLVDLRSLAFTDEIRSEWGQGLRAFLERRCQRDPAGHFLIARYNSGAPIKRVTTPALKQLMTQISDQAQFQGFDANIEDTREEAIKLLLRLLGGSGGPLPSPPLREGNSRI